MNKIEKVSYSFLIASGVTLLKIAHRKIGGLLSGGNYSESHTWRELRDFIPEFSILFIMFLTGSLVYFFFVKKTVNAICPNCEKITKTSNIDKTLCVKCNKKVAPLEGYYKRQSKQ